MQEQKTRFKRLSIWFLVNTIIFVTCYLNYRLQLKHRYLYKTLNVGLCFSRAAAMVINFNLLLVWLPMCKYSLTRLAVLANNSLRHQKQSLLHHQKLMLTNGNSVALGQQPGQLQQQQCGIVIIDGNGIRNQESSKLGLLLSKVRSSANGAIWQLRHWFYNAKLNSISSFLIAVDHCTSLHTICATTITIASVIHTVAHLMNVINFSNNYDPLLSNLNMAEFRGQNPLQLLVSVPGITGSLMVIILILMSLSSMGFIRNSSYDLFQIFHRLSVIFVILLFLHPSSHVLKEQSNIDRHNPELCYNKMAATTLNSTTTIVLPLESNLFAASQRTTTRAPPRGDAPQQLAEVILSPTSTSEQNENHQNNQGRQLDSSAARRLYSEREPKNNHHSSNKTITDLNNVDDDDSGKYNHNASSTTTTTNKPDFPAMKLTTLAINRNNTNSYYYNYQKLPYHNNKTIRRNVDNAIIANNQVRMDTDDDEWRVRSSFCLDPKPLFVAQSSICWYVLSVGLSCYLVDLILRKSRRSKSSIQLLDVRLDCEGNLIELILSNNHRRFAQWLPGQYVYLNCPHIAAFEWHPFTISSMDNRSGQFTLHIKTGGDWTRKLRESLECMQNSMSLSNQKLQNQLHYSNQLQLPKPPETSKIFVKSSPVRLHVPVLPDFDCYNKTGKLQVECTKLVCIKNESERHQQEKQLDQSGNCFKIDLKNSNHQELYSICHNVKSDTNISHEKGLELYIDGPFHSPFERLLEQQVSVCIANGVGWTAFSSVFHCLTNNFIKANDDNTTTSWWSQWRNFAISTNNSSTNKTADLFLDSDGYQINVASNFMKYSNMKLHLMVIVTSVEQLKPFYELAIKYFDRVQDECQISIDNQLNPVREITAFLTRSTKDDQNVKDFCRQENLSIFYEDHIIRVNDVFTIHFGKPKFDFYLSAFSAIYPNSKKISVYCCGSFQVKNDVREICLSLNKTNKRQSKRDDKELRPIYSYHEENF